MPKPPPTQVFGPAICRLADVMAHSKRYAFRGTTRLAFDAGVSTAAVSRIVHGRFNPSSAMLNRLATALERDFGIPIDPRDLIAEFGKYPTRFVCNVVGCSGCLPDSAYDRFGDRLAAFADVLPGEWVCSRYPKGLITRKEHHAS